MLKSVMLTFGILAASVSQTNAEIEYDWSRSKCPLDKRPGIEKMISQAARKYNKENA